MFQRDPRAGAFLGGDRVSGQDIRDQNGTFKLSLTKDTKRMVINPVIAAQSIANIVKSSLGPMGLDKMLVDNIGVGILLCNVTVSFYAKICRKSQSPTMELPSFLFFRLNILRGVSLSILRKNRTRKLETVQPPSSSSRPNSYAVQTNLSRRKFTQPRSSPDTGLHAKKLSSSCRIS